MDPLKIGALTISHVWKPLIHPKILELDFPSVECVDCSNCRMVRAFIFPRHSKCCARVPEFTNFVMGDLLENGTSDENMEIVNAWLEDRSEPMWVAKPPSIREYEEKVKDHKDWIACPFYRGGQCSIYMYRPNICAIYHCIYPDPPEIHRFWNTLGSLLALINAITGQYLCYQLGVDIEKYRRLWGGLGHERDIWTEDHTIKRDFWSQLWEGMDTPEQFYRSCYRYIMDHQDTIYEELDQFRRKKLIERLKARGVLTPERQAEIENQPLGGVPLEPPPKAAELLQKELIVSFADNDWTLYEMQSFSLWYHQKVWGTDMQTQ